jgi:O-antigen/teichoic acid export membrane protein
MDINRGYTIFGRQVGYVIGASIAIALLALIQLPILTKGLGTTLYGTWSLIKVTISLVVPFALLGFESAIVRFLSAEKDKAKISEDFLSAGSTVFIFGAVLSLLLFLFSDYLASSIFKDIDSSSYIKLASILILFNALDGLTLTFFRMQRKIGLYTTLNISRNALQVGLIVAAVLMGYELTGVIIAVIASGAVFVVINLFIILRQTGLRLPRFSNTKSYLRWGAPLIPNFAILWIIQVSDRYIVSYFLGVAAAGIYSAAYTMANYAAFVLSPLSIVLYPTIIKLYEEKEISETRKYLKYSLKYFMLIALPSAFGLSILAQPLLSLLTKPEFVTGNTVVPFVAFSAVFFGFYRICLYIIFLVNRTGLTVRLLGTAAALNIVLNIILIPPMGIVGAAVATLVAYVVLGMLTLIVSRRYLKFDLSLLFVLKSAIASAIMALCIYLFDPASVTEVIISIVGGILIYFGVLLIMKGLSKSEIRFFLNFVKEHLQRLRLGKGRRREP